MARPNILLICTDQQRFDSLGCYGNPHVRTPTLDRLAAEGTLFERCYVQNPVCSPSRASLFTGLYPHAHGLWANGVSLPAGTPMFTKALADAGYDGGMIGKMHLSACFGGRTEPRHDDGFRSYEWAHDPSHASPDNAYHRWLEETFPDLYRSVAASAQTEDHVTHEAVAFDDMPAEAHYTRWVAERAIAFLTEDRDSETPFFLMANFFDPHHPFVAPKEYLERYDADELPLPISAPGELDSKPAVHTMASRESYAGHARGFVEYGEREIRESIAAYYAMIDFIDDEVARILEALDGEGLSDDTLVVFTSDHGEMLGDHSLMLKGPMLYEAAVRVPLILRWPGRIPAGERREQVVEWFGLGRGLLSAAGLPPLPGTQAEDLLPLALDGGEEGRGWAVCEYRDSGHPYEPPVHATMLRQGQYKLVVYHGPPASDRERAGELYDLSTDPDELVNRWDHPDSLRTRLRLQEQLLDVLVATEDRRQAREAHW